MGRANDSRENKICHFYRFKHLRNGVIKKDEELLLFYQNLSQIPLFPPRVGVVQSQMEGSIHYIRYANFTEIDQLR